MKVSLLTKQEDKIMDHMKHIAASSGDGNILIARNLLSTEIVKFLVPICVGTQLSPNAITDKIFTQYPIEDLIQGVKSSADDYKDKFIYNIMRNEMYKIALESSQITGKENVDTYNANIGKIKSICSIVSNMYIDV